MRSEEEPGGWSLELGAKRTRTWHLQASLATLETPFVPCVVDWNGRALPEADWSYEPGTRVLRASFRGRRGRLAVHACG